MGTGKTAVLIGVASGPHWEATLSEDVKDMRNYPRGRLGTFFPGREAAVGRPWGRSVSGFGKSREAGVAAAESDGGETGTARPRGREDVRGQ